MAANRMPQDLPLRERFLRERIGKSGEHGVLRVCRNDFWAFVFGSSCFERHDKNSAWSHLARERSAIEDSKLT